MKIFERAIKAISFSLFILILSSAPLLVRAQAHFDDTEPDGTDITDSPIDGGIVLLVIAGIGFGAKKLYDVKKEKNNIAKPVFSK